MSKLERFLNIDDFRSAAKRRAHRMVFDYIDAGEDYEITLGRNSAAFDDYDLLFKVLERKPAVSGLYKLLFL